MRTELLKKLCCPFDKSDLMIEVIKEHEGEIYEGILTCPCCNRYYPIIYGIPIMTPDEYRERSLELPLLKKWGLAINEEKQSFELTSHKAVKEIEK